MRKTFAQRGKRILAIALSASMAIGMCNFSTTRPKAATTTGKLYSSSEISAMLGTTRTEESFNGSYLSVTGYASVNGGVKDRSEYVGTSYYVTASDETELLEAIEGARKGEVKVIEITDDMNLGWWELTEEQQEYGCIEPYAGLTGKAAPMTNPILIESGVSELSIANTDGLTIFSKNGATIRHAELKIQAPSNDIVIRNLKFCEMWEWTDFYVDEAGNVLGDPGTNKKSGWTNIKVNGANNVWIDHCDFGIAFDGNVDVENAAKGVTISWCNIGAEDIYLEDGTIDKNSMIYKTAVYLEDLYQKNKGKATADKRDFVIYRCLRDAGVSMEQFMAYANYHSKCHLVGSGDKDVEENKQLQITLAFNKYESIGQRIPLLRGGNGLVLNCYVTDDVHKNAYNAISSKISTAEKNVQKIYEGARVPNKLWRATNSRCGASTAVDTCVYEGGVQSIVGGVNDGVSGVTEPNDVVILNSSWRDYKSSDVYVGSSFDNKGSNAFTKGYGYKYDSLDFDWTQTQGASLPFNYKSLPLSEVKSKVLEYAGYGALSMSDADWMKVSYDSSYSVTTAGGTTALESVALNISDTDLFVGDTVQVGTLFTPYNATDKRVTYTSSDTGVLKVSDSGLAEAVGEGTANLTVTAADGGRTATVEVRVRIPVTDIKLSDTQLHIKKVGGFSSLKANVLPENATSREFVWSSSNEDIVTVSENGRVTAVSEGSATIYATSVQNPEVKSKCDVIVGDGAFATGMEPVAGYDFESGSVNVTAGTAKLVESDRSDTAGKALSLDSADATVSITNPFVGRDDLLETPTYDSDGFPIWKKGVTISYWVKTVSETDSNLVTFNNTERVIGQSSDMMYYKVCEKYNPDTAENPSDDFYLGTKSYYTSEMDGKGTEYTVYSDYGRFAVFSPEYPGMGYTIDESKGTITAYSVADNTEVKLSFMKDPLGYKKAGEAIYRLYSKFYDADGDDYAKNSLIRYAKVKGSLRFTAQGNFDFCEDDGTGLNQCPNNGTFNVATPMQKENRLKFSVENPATAEKLEWHYVTVVIKNDDVLFYMDGVRQDYPVITGGKNGEWYDNRVSRGFNLGYGMGPEYSTTRANYSSGGTAGVADPSLQFAEEEWRTACTMLEWLTDENTTLELGGNGGYQYGWEQGYAATKTELAVVAGTQLDDLTFYDTPMSASEVYALYQLNLHGAVESIEMKSLPTATYVMQEEDFDVAGGVVTATYEDGYTEDVELTNGMLSYYDVAGVQTVTVEYQGKETTFDITVVSKEFKFDTKDISKQLYTGYATDTETVYIRQAGTEDTVIDNVVLTVSGVAADYISLNNSDGMTVPAGAVCTGYAVTLDQGLEEGTYTAQLDIYYATYLKKTVQISYTVVKPVYTLETVSEELLFPTVKEGYHANDVSIAIPVTNTGNIDVEITNVEFQRVGATNSTGSFVANKTSGVVAIGKTSEAFTVSPVEGLRAGTYKVKVKFTYKTANGTKSVSTAKGIVLDVEANPVVSEPAPSEKASEAPAPSEKVSEAPIASEKASEAPAPSEKVSEAPAPSEKASEAPAPSEKVSEAPIASEKASEKPVASEEASKAPVASEEASKAPVASEEASKAPVASEEASKAPVASEEASKAPVVSEEASETPATSEETTETPAPSENESETPVQSPQPSKYSKGDGDGNGKIELADAQLALKVALKITKADAEVEDALDVDENGKVELSDAQQILKVALKISDSFTKAEAKMAAVKTAVKNVCGLCTNTVNKHIV